ncbi:type III toxin-antitoxin system TenpIN family toxin [Pantoea allii]|jgi:protein AbiQ|uniref:type III toxin-antitoxin system TenpIN family toxin n=1 Tax=Pantoea TaxID=53335 RepID=UPI000496161A|nr:MULTISPECIES: hypothetical protein [Pantoea]NQE78309.1 hypothetical protein [Pantoea ananatis]NQE82287.1 hypothetical protein [Pantoea ananatis]ORM85514.1 hypothetical protein HA38_11565 [Pantoea allii]PBK00778.1 hypothetical protein CMR03_08565 [Pantoea allii]
MELKKLDDSFYVDNPVLIQALDFDNKEREWMLYDAAGEKKTRGHGIVKIELNGLTFAIPVRSNIQHDESFILEVNRSRDRRNKGMGLDYQKAVLIRDAAHISNEDFVLRTKQAGRKLVGKEEHITTMFTHYVEKYIKAVRKNDRNILNSMEYRFTTLINYHAELGLP